jgi:hypothetical protein
MLVDAKGPSTVRCSRRRMGAADPQRPVAVFSVNDRSTLELDLRQRRQAKPKWRKRSFAEAGRRPEGLDSFGAERLHPTAADSRCRPSADVEPVNLAAANLPFDGRMHELQRRHHQTPGAFAPGGLQLQRHLPGGVGLHMFVGQCWAGDVAAQSLQRLAVIRPAAHCSVLPVDICAQVLLEVRIPGNCALHRQPKKSSYAGAESIGGGIGSAAWPTIR